MNKLSNIINLGLYLTLISCLTVVSDISCGKLTIAINRVDINEIEKLLAEKGSLTETRKNKLLLVAKESIKNRGTATYDLSKSKQDILRIILGTASTLAGCWLFRKNVPPIFANFAERVYRNTHEIEIDAEYAGYGTRKARLIKEPLNYKKIAIKSGKSLLGAALISYGLREIYRGWKLHTAFSNLKTAYKIKRLIEKSLVKNS